MPHHLLDIWDVTEPASVAEYQRLARAAVDDILARGRVPLLVGGSGLYVRAVLEEFEFPGTDPALRARLEAELAEVGPAAAARPAAARSTRRPRRSILPGNGRRIVRALEVIELTGGPFTAALPEPTPVLRRRCSSASTGTPRRWTSGSPPGSTGCGPTGWSTRSGRWSAHGLRDGRTAGRALGYQQVLRLLDGELHRGAGARRDGPRDPAVRPPAAVLVPPRPADRLAGRRPAGPGRAGRRPSAARCAGGAGRDDDGRVQFTKGHGTGNDFVILADPDGELR